MIKEAYVSFELAKLLKERGFVESCYGSYSVRSKEFHLDTTRPCNNGGIFLYSAPTHQMAMAWLREVHNLQIQITPIISRHKDWTFGIYKEFNPLTIDLVCFPTYEQAVETALKYSLENLI